jgi:hypothetical protein
MTELLSAARSAIANALALVRMIPRDDPDMRPNIEHVDRQLSDTLRRIDDAERPELN